ncbi:uncharacterized protein LOC111909796 [Lactuca sativa]|uniref:uncharacterized protein LOC111909796 n=1 Tax=Lactuca sativa TaxID=4236 RepID=UPI0022AFB2C3|nr:uncharacterized protein LOC111909796 [Lactuca sativa]
MVEGDTPLSSGPGGSDKGMSFSFQVWDVIDPRANDPKKDNVDIEIDPKKKNVAIAVIFQAIPEDLILQVGMMDTAKEIWYAIKTRNLGADRVREARLQTLITEFDNLKMKESATIDEYASQLSGIVSKSSSLGETVNDKKMVKNFLTSLPRRFIHIVASIEQILDLRSVGFEDVVGRLKAYEERTCDDSDQGKLLLNNESGRGKSKSGGRSRGSRNNNGKTHQQNLSLNSDGGEIEKVKVEKETGNSVKTLRTDRGGEFTSQDFNSLCDSHGMMRHLTTPYTLQQNGVVERRNRTLIEMTRSLMKETQETIVDTGVGPVMGNLNPNENRHEEDANHGDPDNIVHEP